MTIFKENSSFELTGLIKQIWLIYRLTDLLFEDV